MKKRSNLYYLFQWDFQRNARPAKEVEKKRKKMLAVIINALPNKKER